MTFLAHMLFLGLAYKTNGVCEGNMSFADQFGGFKNINRNNNYNRKSSLDMLIDGLEENRRNLSKNDGAHISENMRNKRRWFIKMNNNYMFRPCVGLYSLFGDKFIEYKPGEEGNLLDALDNAIKNNDLEIDMALKDIDKKRSRPRKVRDKKLG